MGRGKKFIRSKANCCGKTDVHIETHKHRSSKSCCHPKVYEEADVIVVGSGMSGTIAALAASKQGASVILLEAEGSLGGTTLQSGSTIWMPNMTKTFDMATVIKALGLPMIGPEYSNLPSGFDLKGPALEYMSSLSMNEIYNSTYQYLGIPPDMYQLIEDFYDRSHVIIEDELLPYVNTLRAQYNTLTSSSQKDFVYNTNMHALTSGFTLTQSPTETFSATTDPSTTDTFGVIPGYCYSVTDTPGFFSMEPDYFDKTNITGTCIGRQYLFFENNGTSGFTSLGDGGVYLKRWWAYLQTVLGQKIQTLRRVISVKEGKNSIIIKAVDISTNTEHYYKAKKGIVFGSGGFSHNDDQINKHLIYADVEGTCSSNGCRGDLNVIADLNDWELTQMKQAFFNQQTLNDIGTNTQSIQWFLWYSSMMVINKFGNRVFSETAKYNERAKVHFAWDASYGYYNKYLFMVIDRSEYNRQRSSTLAHSKAFSVVGNGIPINTKIQTICSDIATWFGSLANLSDFNIDATTMATGFINTINTYHSYCSTGLDEQFSRQNNDSGRHWLAFGKFVGGQFITKTTSITETTDWRLNDVQVGALYGPSEVAYFNSIATYPYTYPDSQTFNICPDITLQPIIDPVVVVLVPTTLDTKGGPLTSRDMKVVSSKGTYVAGNCGGSSFTGAAYWGAGGTLGPALFTGWTAGTAAGLNDYVCNEGNKFSNRLNLLNFMSNQYPERTISLEFADPINITLAIRKRDKPLKVFFKLSTSNNEYVGRKGLVGSDWLYLPHTILSTQPETCITFVQVVLSPNTFTNAGRYLMTFQIADTADKSLGAAYAEQELISVIAFNNINNYTYVTNPSPANSIVLTQDGGFWTGKTKVISSTGFPETFDTYNIYLHYKQPSHNFNLAYGFQFDTLADVIAFSPYVYAGVANQALDASTVMVTAASAFNFTFNPSPPPGPLPNVVIVANLDIGFYQPWFGTLYDVPADGYTFPKNEVSNFAYVSTSVLTKNWYFNVAATQPGKYTLYFYYCQPHRFTSIHIGWFLVKP